MAQHYKAVLLDEKNESSSGECVRTWLETFNYDNGAKLTQHSRITNNFVTAVEGEISPNGSSHRCRLVWAGNYADPEPLGYNLYQAAIPIRLTTTCMPPGPTVYRFIVNHTKRQYLDKEKSAGIHPLPLLTAEGNGRGDGDYSGPRQEDVGIWARDLISAEETPPGADYTEFLCGFAEPGSSSSEY